MDLPLIARGVNFSYRGGFTGRTVQALTNASIDLQPSGVTALLGPNGSGKSTLLHCLLGILKPTAGEIKVMGLRPGHPDALQQIGFLPEKDPPWGRLSGREVLHFSAGLHGLDKVSARARAEELLAILGLTEAADRLVTGYSKGMGRRLSLAAALIHNPQLLILDEPTAGLDPLGSGLVLDLLNDLGKQGVAILLSSHHYHEVEALAQRVSVLDRGTMAAAGPINEILADPDCWEFTTSGLSEADRKQVEKVICSAGKLQRSGPALLGLDSVLRQVRQMGEE